MKKFSGNFMPQGNILFFGGIFFAAIIAVSFFDRALAAGLSMLAFLTVVTFACMYKLGLRDKKVYIIFLITLLVHIAVVLFINYAGFRPFGGGADFEGYNQSAITISGRFAQGNFSLEGLYAQHYFPILIGVLYIVTVPAMIVGQLFTVWLAALAILFAYLLIIEIGGSSKTAFWASLVLVFYPSYLYFGSVLLKDTLVIPFVLLGLLLAVKMYKKFAWLHFILFFIVITSLINLRFYVAYALLFSFIICWFVLSSFALKKRWAHGLLLVFLLGFSPYLLQEGYYGLATFKDFLDPSKISFYRELVYNPTSTPQQINKAAEEANLKPAPAPSPAPQNSSPIPSITPEPKEVSGNGSTFIVETGFDKGPLVFLKNQFISFVYALFGPFPWQITLKRQLVGLVEMIPWWICSILFIAASINFIRKKSFKSFLQYYKYSLPLIIFGILAIGALSLFINNYGIIARIRIPMWMCFISVMSLVFQEYDYAKIFNRGRSWFYRLAS